MSMVSLYTTTNLIRLENIQVQFIQPIQAPSPLLLKSNNIIKYGLLNYHVARYTLLVGKEEKKTCNL